jgi:hypothetical protein
MAQTEIISGTWVLTFDGATIQVRRPEAHDEGAAWPCTARDVRSGPIDSASCR